MSIADECCQCSTPVDLDDDPDAFEDDQVTCESCRRYNTWQQVSEDHHNDPRRR